MKSNIIFLDTNILSELAERESLWSSFGHFLIDNNLTIGLSTQLHEIQRYPKNFELLTEFFKVMPVAILKTGDVIIKEEVESHPYYRSGSICTYFVPPWETEEFMERAMGSENIKIANGETQKLGNLFPSLLEDRKPNFPVASSGKYEFEQLDEYAFACLGQTLVRDYPNFYRSFEGRLNEFKPRVFLSQRCVSAAIFYDYYVLKHKPKISDAGDHHHKFIIPYCKIAVLERHASDILHLIQKKTNILNNTEIYNIDFLKTFSRN
ncbi:MAG: hypothetical protein WBI17_07590 [Clostridiaceae bacterium]